MDKGTLLSGCGEEGMPIKEGGTGIVLDSRDCQSPGKLSPKGYIILVWAIWAVTSNAQLKNNNFFLLLSLSIISCLGL